ncbi:uncharacterized protein MONOS_11838 [Monocercomonoides exilis]|uniref:uncharacterized protein n=1 Tax=Monocercomonoides exilis TaxID=2049356 RepID=UPI00355AB2D5|nr:hypothetical protein MONOS_11838 [Monocercomonoides exilis]|eukprot:MONOS_11838.1-p1 / transcript=MONOS_11838.1 / gene=MONOS_11838 / organism=Monocercomonoides_exilis_PA203 / gene_product=unspecified product / transcript_product=unspecified product / location=Mono_scaffold00617:6994-7218(-) / protein_length=75 / sequence_SO=supercontig / SO=protein_coding / is_pseudo=false
MKQTVIEDDVDGGENEDIHNGDENAEENKSEEDEEEEEAVHLKSAEEEKASAHMSNQILHKCSKRGIFDRIGVW